MVIRMYKYFLVTVWLVLAPVAAIQAQTVTFTSTNVTCNGGSDGTITITLSGGTSQYRYVYYKFFDPSDSDSVGPQVR